MEQLMDEIHASVCGDPSIKEAQVFVSTLVQLLTKGSEYDMKKTRCWATPQRWLLTLDMHSLSTTLWNPLNQKKVELPCVEKNLPENSKCLLSCEPTSPRCVVLIVDADEPVIWFCRVGGKEWARHEYTITVEKSPILFHYLPGTRRDSEEECVAEFGSHGETSSEHILNGDGSRKRRRISNDVVEYHPYERFKIRSIVAVDGKFYFDISTTELGVIDFLPDPTFATIKFEKLEVSRDCWELAFPHLIESRGRLYLVVYISSSLHTMVLFKMDFSRLKWCTICSLYDQVIFTGRLHFTAAYPARELGLKQSVMYYLEGGYYLFTLSFGEKYNGSKLSYHKITDLPESLLSIYNVLARACCFTIGSS